MHTWCARWPSSTLVTERESGWRWSPTPPTAASNRRQRPERKGKLGSREHPLWRDKPVLARTCLLPLPDRNFTGEWDGLANDKEGCRGSAQYQQSRLLLHCLYEPVPVAEHCEQVHCLMGQGLRQLSKDQCVNGRRCVIVAWRMFVACSSRRTRRRTVPVARQPVGTCPDQVHTPQSIVVTVQAASAGV